MPESPRVAAARSELAAAVRKVEKLDAHLSAAVAAADAAEVALEAALAAPPEPAEAVARPVGGDGAAHNPRVLVQNGTAK